MTLLDQDRAGRLVDVARWRTVYQHTTSDSGDGRAEIIAWFETTADAAWAEAATQLPPPGYYRPDAVTVERGTFTLLPEGGYGWQTLGPTQTAEVDDHGLTFHTDGDSDPAPAGPTSAVAAGQSTLF